MPKDVPFKGFSLEAVYLDAVHLADIIRADPRSGNLAILDSRDIFIDSLSGTSIKTSESLEKQGISPIDLFGFGEAVLSPNLYKYMSPSFIQTGDKDGVVSLAGGFAPREGTQSIDWSGKSESQCFPVMEGPDRAALTWANDHEIGHYVSSALALPDEDKFFDHLEELRADGFAAALSVLRFNDEHAGNFISTHRSVGYITGGDVNHWSSYLMSDFIEVGKQWKTDGKTLDSASFNPFDLMLDISSIVREKAMAPDELAGMRRDGDKTIDRGDARLPGNSLSYIQTAKKDFEAWQKNANTQADRETEWRKAMIIANPQEKYIIEISPGILELKKAGKKLDEIYMMNGGEGGRNKNIADLGTHVKSVARAASLIGVVRANYSSKQEFDKGTNNNPIRLLSITSADFYRIAKESNIPASEIIKTSKDRLPKISQLAKDAKLAGLGKEVSRVDERIRKIKMQINNVSKRNEKNRDNSR